MPTRDSSRIGPLLVTLADHPPRPHPLALPALAGACFAMSLNVNALAAVGSWMKADLGFDDARYGQVVAAAGIAAAVASLLLGGLVDRLGRRPPLLLGLLLFCLGSAGYLFIDSFAGWIAVRVATGFVGGVVLTSASSAVADLVPYARRGRAMGIVTAAILLAVPIGMPIATVLADLGHWRAVFGIQVVAGLVALVVLWRNLPRGLGRAETRPSLRAVIGRRDVAAALLSVVLYTGAFFAVTQFLSDWLHGSGLLGRERHWMVWIALGVFAAGGSALLGPLVDHSGKRRFVLITTLIVAVGLALLGRTGSVAVFAAIGIPIAVASASRSAALLALLTDLVPSGQRGTLMGLRNAANSLGTGTVPVLAGYVVAQGGFPTFLLIAGGLMLVSWLLIVVFVRDDRLVSEDRAPD